MKRTMMTVAMATCLISANAGTLWVTNSLSDNEALSIQNYAGTYAIILPTSGAAAITFTPNENFIFTGAPFGTESIFMPSSGDNYSWDITDGIAGTSPVLVPEPQAFTLFMIGFALVFGSGMMATGARWVRQLIVGDVESL